MSKRMVEVALLEKLLACARDQRDRLAHDVGSSNYSDPALAQKLVDAANLVLELQTVIDTKPVPRGMFNKNGNVD